MKPSSAKAKGREAENGAVEFLAVDTGLFPLAERRRQAGALDKGDISGTHPDLCWEVKSGQLDIPGWMGETETERINSGAKHGFLVVKPARMGWGKRESWWVFMPAETYARLAMPGSWRPRVTMARPFAPAVWLKDYPVVQYKAQKSKRCPTDQIVLTTLSELCSLLYTAGYGRGLNGPEDQERIIESARLSGDEPGFAERVAT